MMGRWKEPALDDIIISWCAKLVRGKDEGESSSSSMTFNISEIFFSFLFCWDEWKIPIFISPFNRKWLKNATRSLRRKGLIRIAQESSYYWRKISSRYLLFPLAWWQSIEISFRIEFLERLILWIFILLMNKLFDSWVFISFTFHELFAFTLSLFRTTLAAARQYDAHLMPKLSCLWQPFHTRQQCRLQCVGCWLEHPNDVKIFRVLSSESFVWEKTTEMFKFFFLYLREQRHSRHKDFVIFSSPFTIFHFSFALILVIVGREQFSVNRDITHSVSYIRSSLNWIW